MNYRYEATYVDSQESNNTLVEMAHYVDTYKRQSYYRTLVLDVSSPYGEPIIAKSIKVRNKWLGKQVFNLLVRRYIRR